MLTFDPVKRIGEREHGLSPLPIETVRDLLGVVRALYAFHRERGAHGFASELHRAGRQLREAIELSKGAANAHAHAWRLANEAIATIGRVQLNARAGELKETVAFAAGRVTARRDARVDREAKRQARVKRG